MNVQHNRLAKGGRIDRSRLLSFRFDGKELEGYAGDTLASALLANDIHFVARSFKYHRPRGILSAGAEEANALVTVGKGARATPNQRATQIELHQGLEAKSQNHWPSLHFDVGVLNDWLSFLYPAGFYYKTFMWPPGFWMYYERFIRRAAGLGRCPSAPDPDRYEKRYAHADVLVVGAGPAGLAAALAAGSTGARVILADEQAEFGGSLLSETAEIAHRPATDWLDATVNELKGLEEGILLKRSTVAGYYNDNFLTIVERAGDHAESTDHTSRVPRERLWLVRSKQVVLATGAIEQPLVFAGNDRPGVLLADAARTYVRRYGVQPGKRAVVFTNNDSAYGAALAMAQAGMGVQVIDLRSEPGGPLVERVRDAGVEVLHGHAIVATWGRKRVRAVDVMRLDGAGASIGGRSRRFECDIVAMSGGWNPTVHLFSQSRGTLEYGADLSSFVPGESFQAERSAGACNGAQTLERALEEGFKAGASAACDAGFGDGRPPTTPSVEADGTRTVAPRALWNVPSVGGGQKLTRHFIDLQNDVTAADIRLAAREGYFAIEHLKRYTTTGMGTDQGKTSNLNALAVMAEIRDATIPEVGHTTFRPPYTPVTFGAIAGRDIGDFLDATRRTPMHDWHESHGAVFENVGQWKRPRYYAKSDETMLDAVNREALAARTGVGILDASTLGKIEIEGPDALSLLNMVYTNDLSKLEIGRCRYGLMLREDGMVFDDGTTTRLGDNHYLMTTTTGNAAAVLSWLEEWLQTEWPQMRVFCTSVTDAWATLSICGPRCRELLSRLTRDIDLGADAFPFMTMLEGTVAGAPARVLRISFTGELSYEINVPAGYGVALWEALMEIGKDLDICAYGTEAMHVLRAERGFIIVGQETDGTVTPDDIGMDWIVSKTKTDFLGRRSLVRSDTVRPDRKQLVGLVCDDPAIVLPEGAHLVEADGQRPPMATLGHVTSSYFSPNVGRGIALALIRSGRSRIGQRLYAPLADGHSVAVAVNEATFLDKEGARARG